MFETTIIRIAIVLVIAIVAPAIVWFWLPLNFHGEPMPSTFTRKIDGKKALRTALAVAAFVVPVMTFVVVIMTRNADNARLARGWNYACGDMPDGVEVAAVMEEHARELDDIKTRVGGNVSIDRVEARDARDAFCGPGLSMILARYDKHSQIAPLQAAFPENAFHGIPVRISSAW